MQVIIKEISIIGLFCQKRELLLINSPFKILLSKKLIFFYFIIFIPVCQAFIAIHIYQSKRALVAYLQYEQKLPYRLL